MIFRRLLESIPTFIALSLLTFIVMRVAPGGPFDSEKALPAEVKANLEAKFHLNEPVLKQYARYMANVMRGDFGPSYRTMGSRDVSEIISESLPVSIQLGGAALFFAIIFGIPIGLFSAYNRGRWIDHVLSFLASAGISIPNFIVASVLVLVFSVWLKVLPPALWEDWTSMVLPCVVLGTRPLGLIARLTRASVLEALSSDYIRTARAKGLSFSALLFKHALKNALVPVITLLGPIAAALITGSFVVEVIFAIPGMGKYFVGAVLDRDYTLIMGVTMVYGAIVIVFNLLVDILYGIIDPRMKSI